MKKRILLFIKPALFLLLGAVMFCGIQDIFTPRWNNNLQDGRTVTGIKILDVPHLDALFLGTSSVRLGISPMELYKQYGIVSYDLGTSAQQVSGSYFLLKEAYQTHSIDTVFFDVSAMFFNEVDYTTAEINPAWRYILDNLDFGPLKIQMAKEYAEYGWSDGFFAAIFPIIKYHSSWDALAKENFNPPKKMNYYSFGQNVYSQYVASPHSMEDIEYAARFLYEYTTGKLIEKSGNAVSSLQIGKELYRPAITAENLAYFLKIINLCEAHHSQLILLKIPTNQLPQYYRSAWTSVKSDIITELSMNYELKFLDLQYDIDGLVTFETDTTDAGIHLNALGAKKISNYLGEYMINQGLAQPRRELVYDEALEKYEKVFSVVELQTTTDFQEYLSYLKTHGGNWTVSISTGDEYVLGLSDSDHSALRDLGLEVINQGEFRDSYVALVSRGQTLYEAVSDYEIVHEAQVDGVLFTLASRNGWLTPPGASIRVDGVEHCWSAVGLNIVVYDHETNCVIDAVAFNTNQAEKPCTRNQGKMNQYLRAYESTLCFGGR